MATSPVLSSVLALFLTSQALRFLSHPSVTTASIMWEIVSGAGCWNRATCARLSVSATCRREGRRMYSAGRMSKHFSDTRERIFRARVLRRRQENVAKKKKEKAYVKMPACIAATLFGVYR